MGIKVAFEKTKITDKSYSWFRKVKINEKT